MSRFPDRVLGRMQELGIQPILDLVHFGLPDWLGSFQNPDWPRHVAAYARAVAERYPWIRARFDEPRDAPILAPRLPGHPRDGREAVRPG